MQTPPLPVNSDQSGEGMTVERDPAAGIWRDLGRCGT